MSSVGRGFHYAIDPELGLIHASPEHLNGTRCPAARVAYKYNTVEMFTVYDGRDAAELDRRGRPCHRCWEELQRLAKRKGARPIPGFKTEPRP